MQNVIGKINKLVQSLNALQPMKREFQVKLDEKFRMEFNYNSNHIEGNTLTYGETKLLLLFDKTDGVHEMREYEEMKAHDVAYKLIQECAINPEYPLTEAFIKQLNEIILVKPFWKEARTYDGQPTRRLIKVGQYKEHPNSVQLQNGEMFHYTSPMDTPIQMGELVRWYLSETEKKELNPVELAALLHYKFVCIHPFDDGNGRISRLLMNYVLLKNNLPPIIIKSADKKYYLNALNQADVGNIDAFTKYIAEQLVWSLNIAVKAAKGENIDEPEDLDKRIAILERELDSLNPNNDVKLSFNRDVYISIYHTWLSDLIKEVVPAIQKFNRLFTGTNHHIYLANGFASVMFNNDSANEILDKIELQITEKNPFQEHESITRINTSYGTLIKGGLKTFGCNYCIEIKFEHIKYSLFVDEFSNENERKKTKLFEKLLHQPLSPSDIKLVVDKLSDTIYKHIDFHTKKNGLR